MRRFALLLLASVVVVLPQTASADTDLGTANAANWLVTVGGGGSGTPYSMDIVAGWPTSICISSSGTRDGQWVPGASNATFNGFWAAKETFNIPAGATNVSLNFSNLGADDRCVLELNGIILGDYFMNAHPGPGVMSFTTAAVDVPYNFTFVTDGQVTSGFRSGENESSFKRCRGRYGSEHPSPLPFPEAERKRRNGAWRQETEVLLQQAFKCSGGEAEEWQIRNVSITIKNVLA